ncbi:MAG TPA: hypothetical protein VG294_13900 [Solirubrobacteraceae bacterium]|jgi:uncharacterized protein (DUF58 family)|nr:hypothetical protein [Solirubrobacteraceae bacterium]
MWLYIIAFPIGVLIIVGSVVAGGAYTLVGVPVVLLALVSGIALRAIGRVTLERRGGAPVGGAEGSGHGPVTPGELTDARRAQQ